MGTLILSVTDAGRHQSSLDGQRKSKMSGWAVLCASVSMACALPVLAQAPDGEGATEVQYAPDQIRELRGQRVKMRDGVELSVDLFYPDDSDRHATLLYFTPYDNSQRFEIGRFYAARGYSVALADMRGRYDSDGQWDPFNPKHKTDGYDLVEWLAKQKWSNGKVGMTGCSFNGWSQWFTASTAPPSLKAIAPMGAPGDPMRNLPYQEGLLKSALLDWAGGMSGRTAQRRDAGVYGGFETKRLEDHWNTPYVDINRRRGMLDAPWFEKLIQNNLSSSTYFKDIGYQGFGGFEKIEVPSLNIAGWFDEDFPGAPANYIGMTKYGRTDHARSPKLVLGPWGHCETKGGPTRERSGQERFEFGPDADVNMENYTVRWLDHYLKGIDNGIDREPPVYVFVMGANKWYAEKDWPLPQTQWTKFYLESGGQANTLLGDGRLTTTPPTSAGVDRYTYDPAKPTLAPWKGSWGDYPADARVPETGREVLVYTTPPLEADMEVTGPIQAKLFASTSARDTDWIVHLMDVYPDGYAAILAEGVMRARNRDPEKAGIFNPAKLSTIKAGEVYEYTIDFWRTTGNVFKKGHSIRIDIKSSYYPYYLRNLNTGADNNGLADEKDAVVATQTIHHGPRYPSHILLPVIPVRDGEKR